MTKIIQILLFSIFIFSSSLTALAQEKKSNDPDILLKESIYAKYRKEVLAFDKKKFDDLFFEYFLKQKDSNATLTKEEYYTYTIKIATYSEKLGLLYKDQKEEAEKSKQEWFNKMYQDYLNEKNKTK